MAMARSVAHLFFLLLLVSTAPAARDLPAAADNLDEACAETQFPDLCARSLTDHPESRTASPRRLAELSVLAALIAGRDAASFAHDALINGVTDEDGDGLLIRCLDSCSVDVEEAVAHLSALSQEPTDARFLEVRDWLSATLGGGAAASYEAVCKDAPSSDVKDAAVARSVEFEMILSVTLDLITEASGSMSADIALPPSEPSARSPAYGGAAYGAPAYGAGAPSYGARKPRAPAPSPRGYGHRRPRPRAPAPSPFGGYGASMPRAPAPSPFRGYGHRRPRPRAPAPSPFGGYGASMPRAPAPSPFRGYGHRRPRPRAPAPAPSPFGGYGASKPRAPAPSPFGGYGARRPRPRHPAPRRPHAPAPSPSHRARRPRAPAPSPFGGYGPARLPRVPAPAPFVAYGAPAGGPAYYGARRPGAPAPSLGASRPPAPSTYSSTFGTDETA